MFAVLLNGLMMLVLNIPAGYWRESVKKFSFQWFVAIHAAIPLNVGVKKLMGIEFSFVNFAIVLVFYFAGQYIGGCLNRRQKRSQSDE